MFLRYCGAKSTKHNRKTHWMRGSGPGKLIEYADKNQENSLNARLRSWIPAKVIEQDFSQSDWTGFRPKSLNRISAKVIERDFGQSHWTGFRTKWLNGISDKVIEQDFGQSHWMGFHSTGFQTKWLNGASDFGQSHWTELQILAKVIERSSRFQAKSLNPANPSISNFRSQST